MVPGGVGKTLSQRIQLRWLAGLAAMQAGLLQTMTSPPPAGSSSALAGIQPQSMQEIAVGSMAAPQAGHLLPPAAPLGGMLGSWNSPEDGPAPPPPRLAPAP